MDMIKEKMRFEETFTPSESALLAFKGVEGFDVYNCSIPFSWGGRRYIFGRLEREDRRYRPLWVFGYRGRGESPDGVFPHFLCAGPCKREARLP
jgi:hypothetical protein